MTTSPGKFFRFKLKSGRKGSEIAVCRAWISSGDEADAKAWARVQMDAWAWTDGKILECAADDGWVVEALEAGGSAG